MSYAQMAHELGVGYCGGISSRGSYCHLGDHGVGFATFDEVHFRDRMVQRPSTHVFLKLAAQVIDPSIGDDVPWRRVYRLSRLAREAGEQLRIRMPARYWSADKAFVLAGTAGLTNEVPMRKQAFDWARRPPRSTT